MKAKLLLIILMFQIPFLSCKKSDEKMIDAQIIGFDITKCSCCWGWIIKYGNDTIKTDSLPSRFQMDGDFPIKVKIELGEMVKRCSDLKLYDYYKIKSIEMIPTVSGI
jgi:hypothetical protein